MKIEEAFANLVSQRGWYKKGGLDMHRAQLIKHRFKNNLSLTNDKKRELLLACGYEVVVEEQWKPPIPEPIVIQEVVTKTKVRRIKQKPEIVIRTFVEPEFVQKKVIVKTKKDRNKNLNDQFSVRNPLKKKPK